LIPTRLAFKVLDEIVALPWRTRTELNRRKETLQRIGFSSGGLTHRRAPPPAFLFPSNNVKEPGRINFRRFGPYHVSLSVRPP